MLTFELNLGPLRIYFNLGDTPSNEPPPVEYVPAAQVERADPYVSDRAPIEDRRAGFRA